MADKDKTLLTDDDIQKALNVLNGITEPEKKDDLSKSIDPEDAEIDRKIAELQALKTNRLNKSAENEITPAPSAQVDEIVKSVVDSLSSKFESVANISKSLFDGYEELNQANLSNTERTEALSKSIDSITTSLDEIKKSLDEIGNSPVGKLITGKTMKGVSRFPEGQDNSGKETISLTGDKRKILGRLAKSLDTEEGQRRLGDIVGLIENGYVTSDNFGYIQKSLQNELGGDINIIY